MANPVAIAMPVSSPEHELAVAGLLRTLPASSSVRMGTRMSRSAYLVDVVLGFAAAEPEHGRAPSCTMGEPLCAMAALPRVR